MEQNNKFKNINTKIEKSIKSVTKFNDQLNETLASNQALNDSNKNILNKSILNNSRLSNKETNRNSNRYCNDEKVINKCEIPKNNIYKVFNENVLKNSEESIDKIKVCESVKINKIEKNKIIESNLNSLN